jgi:Raf kinase inhibitor-like YbhB/YbcL family protein
MLFSFIACGGGENSASSNDVTLSHPHTDTPNINNNGLETIGSESIDSEFSNISVGYRKIKQTSLSKGTLFASIDGVGETCTKEDPCSIEKGFAKARAGDVLFLRGGVYKISKQLLLTQKATKDHPLIIESYPGEKAIIEGKFTSAAYAKAHKDERHVGIKMISAYTYLRNLEVSYMGNTGIQILYSSNNVIEGCNVHHNWLSGIQVYGGTWDENDPEYKIPYKYGYNTIRDNIVHDNSDAGLDGSSGDGGNADGISISSGRFNKVVHNTTYGNSDDGIDTWRSNDTYVAYNISYDNGRSDGDGNGFKAGGNELKGEHQPNFEAGNGRRTVMEHNIAYNNKGAGFDFNVGIDVLFQYNTAYNNGKSGFIGSGVARTTMKNNIATSNRAPTSIKWGEPFISIDNSWDIDEEIEFISVDPKSKDFLRPKSGSSFEDIGVYGGDVIVYPVDPAINKIDSTEASSNDSDLTLKMNGNFIEKSHFNFFVNVDNNPKTGYSRDGTVNGMDYLVENNTLYRYAGDGKNWKWNKVSSIIKKATSTSYMATIKISSMNLKAGDTIKFVPSVSTHDWKKIVSGKSSTYTLPFEENMDKQTINYNELNSDIKNPERGLYVNHYLASSPYRGYSAEAGNYSWVDDRGYSIFLEKLVLVDFINKPISKEYLSRVRKDFSFARENGLKMMVRVTYNEHMGDPDAPLDVVLGHIEQLKPIYNEYKDVIVSVQAGLIGAWGEWHSSSNGLNNSIDAKNKIKDALLKAVPKSLTVQFRNPPEVMRWYQNPLSEADAYSGSDQSRVGHHDDCFNWNPSDRGTFTGDAASREAQKDYISKISKYTPFVAETCNEDVTHATDSTTSCENALEMAESMHLTSLSDVPVNNNDNVLTPVEIYHNENCWDDIVKKLGYRFILKSATLPTVAKIGSNFSGEIKIKNDGFSALINQREAYIVLENGAKRFVSKLSSEPRKWEAGKTVTANFNIQLPNNLTEGTYKVALWMPDHYDNLKNNPKYSIQTANSNTWNSEKGYNVLGKIELIPSNDQPANETNDNSSQKKLPIVIIGPSTVYIGSELNGAVHPDGSDCRLEGWGERFYAYAKDPEMIYNYARPGSSSTDFPEPPEGKAADVQTLYGPNRDHYWEKVIEKMQTLGKGILLIQYGANEPATTNEASFKENIQTYIDKAKELHFTPVLITEIAKRIRKNGTLSHERGDFPKWMKEVAKENDLQVLDLNKKSYDAYSKYSVAQWHEMFTDCSNRWTQREENTHYEAKGAKRVALWIRELACKEQESKLCKQLQVTAKEFTLESPNFIPENGSPEFSWENTPKGTKSFVLIIDDASAKDANLDWVHWSVINIDKNTHKIAASTIPKGSQVGVNSNGEKGYADPAYPHTHKYVAHLYALDTQDAMHAKFFHGARNFNLDKKYDHKEFERVFGLFILGKSEMASK